MNWHNFYLYNINLFDRLFERQSIALRQISILAGNTHNR